MTKIDVTFSEIHPFTVLIFMSRAPLYLSSLQVAISVDKIGDDCQSRSQSARKEQLPVQSQTQEHLNWGATLLSQL